MSYFQINVPLLWVCQYGLLQYYLCILALCEKDGSDLKLVINHHRTFTVEQDVFSLLAKLLNSVSSLDPAYLILFEVIQLII